MGNEEIEAFVRKSAAIFDYGLAAETLRLDELKYMRTSCPHNYVGQILEALDAGKHVVVSLVPSQICCRICWQQISFLVGSTIPMCVRRNSFADRKTQWSPGNWSSLLKKPTASLTTTVRQTIFGTIAREMRKYFVTLLVVDQRPSGIDNEVMSQIGTALLLYWMMKRHWAIFTGVSGGKACAQSWLSSTPSNKPWS